jgi:ABC-type multidrug transport system ATPase subunit
MGIARTFQNLELFESSTVLENLLLGRHIHRRTSLLENLLFLPKVRRAEVADRDEAERVIEALGLARIAHAPIVSLSYGVRKVVELARALCVRPRLLMLDEPSSGLGAEETATMARWINDVRTRLGIAVIMIEHDMSLVNEVSDRVIALNQGRVIAEGSATAVQNDPEVIRASLSVADMAGDALSRSADSIPSMDPSRRSWASISSSTRARSSWCSAPTARGSRPCSGRLGVLDPLKGNDPVRRPPDRTARARPRRAPRHQPRARGREIFSLLTVRKPAARRLCPEQRGRDPSG